MNIKQRAFERKKKTHELLRDHPSGCLFLTGNVAPYVVAEVTWETAAALLIADTHHIRMAEEVAEHHKAAQQFAVREVDRRWRNNELAGAITALTRRTK